MRWGVFFALLAGAHVAVAFLPSNTLLLSATGPGRSLARHCAAAHRKASSIPCARAHPGTLFMSAARGDACLAVAAKALGSGDLIGAQENLENARIEYFRAGVEDRKELVEQLKARIENGLRPAATPAPNAVATMEGDNVMTEAAKVLSAKDYVGARVLADKARLLFEQAGPEIARAREPLVGNLVSYINIEQERAWQADARKARKAREQQEEQDLEERLEEAASAAINIQLARQQRAPPVAHSAAASPERRQADVCIVVDNGSSRAASTLALRSICAKLQETLGMRVVAASMAHADKAPLDTLGGTPATLLADALREHCAGDKVQSVVVLPLFFGPSLAVTKKIPETLQMVAAERALALTWAVGTPLADDAGLAGILADEVQRTIQTNGLKRDGALPAVILVDHGSPSPHVTAVRDALALRLSDSLTGGLASCVTAASMERREGPAYAFCEPLLEAALPSVADGQSDVVLCMLFLSPGTHAGPAGDIDQICGAALDKAGASRRVFKTALVGELDALVPLLERRFNEALTRL